MRGSRCRTSRPDSAAGGKTVVDHGRASATSGWRNGKSGERPPPNSSSRNLHKSMLVPEPKIANHLRLPAGSRPAFTYCGARLQDRGRKTGLSESTRHGPEVTSGNLGALYAPALAIMLVADSPTLALMKRPPRSARVTPGPVSRQQKELDPPGSQPAGAADRLPPVLPPPCDRLRFHFLNP
jgi:hypothetical protein